MTDHNLEAVPVMARHHIIGAEHKRRLWQQVSEGTRTWIRFHGTGV